MKSVVQKVPQNFGPYAYYCNATEDTVPNATYTVIDFPTKVVDTHSAVATGESWAFTTPKSGLYQISCSVMLSAAAWPVGTKAYLRLVPSTGGSLFIDFWESSEEASPYIKLHGSVAIPLDRDESVSVKVLHYRGGDVTLLTESAASYSYIQIAYAGPLNG